MFSLTCGLIMPVVMYTMRSNNWDAFGVGRIDKRAAYLHIVRCTGATMPRINELTADNSQRIVIAVCCNAARYHGTSAASRYHFSTVPVPSPSRYFLYRNTTSTAVLRHGTCPLLTHSNEHFVFRLKMQPSPCLLSFTAKLHVYLFILCCFCCIVYTK